MPKISVIVPIYNVEKYLRKCLDSIVNQTLQDIEIICINNCSTDDSAKIVLEYMNQDARIVFINKNFNSGYSDSMNQGLKLAQGEYIAICEADDYIEYDMYEKMYAKAKEFNVDVIKSAYYAFDSKKEIVVLRDLGIVEDKVFNIYDDPIFFSQHPSIWSCLYKRDFLLMNNISFVQFNGVGWPDNVFQIEIFLKAERIVFIEKPYYHYQLFRNDSSSVLDGEKLYTSYNTSLKVHDVLLKNIKIAKKDLVYDAVAFREINYIGDLLKYTNLRTYSIISAIVKDFFSLIERDFGCEYAAYLKLKKQYRGKMLRRCIKNELKKILNKVIMKG